MNQDPVYQRLREIGWRRPLTEAEQTELRTWLVAHPEAQAEIETEEMLSAALARPPDAPMPSNFTARVLQAIERDDAAENRVAPPGSSRWWRVFLPRFALATLVVISGGLFYRHHATVQRQELTNAVQQMVTAESLSDPTVLADFEVIASLSPTAAVADEKLLALSEELLALGQ